MRLRNYRFVNNEIQCSGREYRSRIMVVIRKDQRVIIPMMKNLDQIENGFWSLTFIPSGINTKMMAKSIRFIQSHPKLFEQILFPNLFYKQILLSSDNLGTGIMANNRG